MRDDWSTWLQTHGPALVLFARQWAVDRAAAEDIVQEAFVRFWRSRARAVDPKPYLFACVKRCALEMLRGDQRRVKREEAFARQKPDADQPLFIGAAEHDERRAMIEDALMQLPEEQREVLVLKIWGGLTFPQIGESLAISPNTVASRYRYALEKLRERLAAEVIQ
jgi:RNA polymerase sigma-70 factor (ECF subfamily)